MRSAALPRGWRAPQLHAAAPASVTRALPVCAARPRSAQRDTRFHAALAVRGCCTARNAARRFSWLTPSWLTSPLGQGRTRKARVATALQPAPRGGALVASAGEAGEARRGVVYKDAFFNRAAELKSLATLLAGPPRAVLVLTGPPSCGKSGACALVLSLSPRVDTVCSAALLKQLVASSTQSPRPSIIDCRAGGARRARARLSARRV
jgi:hypothetical protein